MGSEIINGQLIMKGDGLGTTYAVKTLPTPPESDVMAFYFRAYVQGYSGFPFFSYLYYNTENPWDAITCLGLSADGQIPTFDGSNLQAYNFLGWIQNNLVINRNESFFSQNDGQQFKQASGVIIYGQPQLGDTISVVRGFETYKFIYDPSGMNSDDGTVYNFYYDTIPDLVAALEGDTLGGIQLFDVSVFENKLFVTLKSNTENAEYRGSLGNAMNISSNSVSGPQLENGSLSGGLTNNFVPVSFGNQVGDAMKVSFSNGTVNNLNSLGFPSASQDFVDDFYQFEEIPYPNRDGVLTNNLSLGQKVTYVWLFQKLPDNSGFTMRLGVNMEGLPLDNISHVRTSTHTKWTSTATILFTAIDNANTGSVFRDSGQVFKWNRYLILKFPDSSSNRKLILDHYKIEYFNYCQ